MSRARAIVGISSILCLLFSTPSLWAETPSILLSCRNSVTEKLYIKSQDFNDGDSLKRALIINYRNSTLNFNMEFAGRADFLVSGQGTSTLKISNDANPSLVSAFPNLTIDLKDIIGETFSLIDTPSYSDRITATITLGDQSTVLNECRTHFLGSDLYLALTSPILN